MWQAEANFDRGRGHCVRKGHVLHGGDKWPRVEDGAHNLLVRIREGGRDEQIAQPLCKLEADPAHLLRPGEEPVEVHTRQPATQRHGRKRSVSVPTETGSAQCGGNTRARATESRALGGTVIRQRAAGRRVDTSHGIGASTPHGSPHTGVRRVCCVLGVVVADVLARGGFDEPERRQERVAQATQCIQVAQLARVQLPQGLHGGRGRGGAFSLRSARDKKGPARYGAVAEGR